MLVVWTQTINNNITSRERLDIGLLSVEISDLLVKQTGQPTNWETGDEIYTLGLAEEDHILDMNKVDEFVNLDYEDAKDLLGVGTYEFYFTLVNASSGATIKTGGMYPINSDVIINSRRVVSINSAPFFIDVFVWR